MYVDMKRKGPPSSEGAAPVKETGSDIVLSPRASRQVARTLIFFVYRSNNPFPPRTIY